MKFVLILFRTSITAASETWHISEDCEFIQVAIDASAYGDEDVTGNGVVNMTDLLRVVSAFGFCP